MGGKIDIQIKHREKVLTLRRLDRLVQSDEFTYIWDEISSAEKLKVTRLIQEGQYVALKIWMLKQLDLGLELYNHKDLRMLASKHHIPYYSRKTRAELIKALTEKGILDGNANRPLSQNETLSGARRHKKMSSGPVNLETTLKISSDSI